MKKTAIFLIICALNSTLLLAGGFQINLQGQKQAGMGHTGTGLLLDNSAILFNPGAVSFLDSLRGISFGTSLIFPRTIYLEPHPGTYTASTEANVGTPIMLYAAFKFKKSKNLSAGIGIYNPFGSRLQWDDNWKGQFLIREINLKTFFIQPTLSYKLNEKLGIGAGFVFATGDFSLRKGVQLQDSTGKYGEAKLSGKARGYGFNAGVYFKATEKLSIGLDYRSQVNVTVDEGTATFDVPGSVAEYFPETKFTTQLRLPQMATLGFGYALNDKLKLAVDINYIGWQSYDSLIIDFEQNTDKLADLHSAKMYKNVFSYRVGGQYKFSTKWTIRLGAYYDMTPVQSGYLSPETPDVNKIGITSGASLRVTKKINLDLSLMFIEGMKRTDTSMETNFSGTYKSRAVVPGFSFGYLF
ncbi:MAG: outer membrane protein transport protein [Bacteroidota bacterium]